jgi:hypothetical protein
MTRIIELQIIFQKPAELEDYGLTAEDLTDKNVFATEGQSEVKKLVQVGQDSWAENTLDVVPVNIPVGVAGMSDIVRRVFIREFATMKIFDKAWEFFYVIATFERPDNTTFFRTIVPRTSIGVPLRNLRRGIQGDRVHGVQPRRRVRRRKL